MKYDDAGYYESNAGNEALSYEDRATHIGMYFAWNAARGMATPDYEDSEIEPVRTRAITGRDFIVDVCDCQLSDGDLNDEGNGFAQWYYESRFVQDYCRVFGVSGDVDEFCSVEDTWANFDKLAPVLDARFAEWKAQA